MYTSNVFAILGLQALYFALAGAMELFHFLNMGLAIFLAFVGVKMLLSKFYEMPVGITLAAVVLTLVITIVASIIFPKSRQNKSSSATPFKAAVKPKLPEDKKGEKRSSFDRSHFTSRERFGRCHLSIQSSSGSRSVLVGT